MASDTIVNEFLLNASRFKVSELTSRTSRRQILLNILREHDQKKALRHPMIMRAKRECGGICPCCKEAVTQLHAAHIGTPRSKIIGSVLDTHPTENDIIKLIEYLDLANKDVQLVIACKECNDRIEDITNPSNTLVPSHVTHTSESSASYQNRPLEEGLHLSQAHGV